MGLGPGTARGLGWADPDPILLTVPLSHRALPYAVAVTGVVLAPAVGSMAIQVTVLATNPDPSPSQALAKP